MADDSGAPSPRRATVALACGVLALVTIPAAPVAVPLGAAATWLGLAYRRDPDPRPGDGRALAGAMAGAVGAVLALVWLLFIVLV